MPDDAQGAVEWRYAIDHMQTYDTRHEAVGAAAIINRRSHEQRREVTVWAYPECGCGDSTITERSWPCCAACGAVVA